MKKLVYSLILPTFLLSNEGSLLDNTLDKFDDTIKSLHENINIYSKNIDEFLTNKYDNSIYNQSFIRFENSFDYSKYENFNYNPTFSLRIKLPKLQERFSLEIDNTDNTIEQNSNDSNEKLNYKDDNYNIGLIYNRLSRGINLSFKTGVKLSTEPFVFIKTSAYKQFEIDDQSSILFKDEIRLSDRYNLDNSFIINYAYMINENYTFSNYNEYFINSIKKDDEIYNSLRLTNKINDKEYLNYVFSTTSNNIDSELEIKEYKLYWSYRRYMKQWLYFDVVPSMAFQEVYNYKINPGVKFNLGLFIGK